MAGLVIVKLLENVIITASEVCLVVYFLRLVSAPASPTTPGRRRQEQGEQGEKGRKWSREREWRSRGQEEPRGGAVRRQWSK